VRLQHEHVLDPRLVDGAERGREDVSVGEDAHWGEGIGVAAGCKALASTSGRSRLTFPAMSAVRYSEARENLKSIIDKVVADWAPLT